MQLKIKCPSNYKTEARESQKQPGMGEPIYASSDWPIAHTADLKEKDSVISVSQFCYT